ncbi:hypothetical protein LXL04_020341 [Taraxacum kok-saghyz]
MDQKRFTGVHKRRLNPDPIIRNKYNEVIFASELPKYGFGEWVQIQDIIASHKGLHALELKLALNSLIEKVQGLKLVRADKNKMLSTSSAAPKPSRSTYTDFLYPLDTKYIHNSPPAGVEPDQHLFIRSLEHSMFYMDSNHQICFHRASNLPRAQIKHLFHLRLECMGHVEQDGFHGMIALKLETRLKELGLDDFKWLKDEILSDVDKENLVCKLKKSLYVLKQAPRQWYLRFDNFMRKCGYNRCEMDHCCYHKKFDSSYIILLLYVDDMLIAGSDIQKIYKLKKQLSREFEMKDLGAAKQILGMNIARDKETGILKLLQAKYIKKVLEKLSMVDAKPRSTPLGSQLKLSKVQSPKTEKDSDQMAKVPYSSAVGNLMYAMVCTRPDISQAVGVISQFMSNPGKDHWEGVKWLLRYLKGTSDVCLIYKKKEAVHEGFTDANLRGCEDSGKITTGFVFTIGGTSITWMSRLKKSIALSTTEAEYMAMAEASKELVWLKSFLSELGLPQDICVLHFDTDALPFYPGVDYRLNGESAEKSLVRRISRNKRREFMFIGSEDWLCLMTAAEEAMYGQISRSMVVDGRSLVLAVWYDVGDEKRHFTKTEAPTPLMGDGCPSTPRWGSPMPLMWAGALLRPRGGCRNPPTPRGWAKGLLRPFATSWMLPTTFMEVIWMQHQMLDYGLNILDTPIFYDNDAAIQIVKNPVQHSKTKHIDINIHFIRDCFERNLLNPKQYGMLCPYPTDSIELIEDKMAAESSYLKFVDSTCCPQGVSVNDHGAKFMPRFTSLSCKSMESMVKGKKVIISEQTIREVLEFGDTPKFPIEYSVYQVREVLEKMYYEGSYPSIIEKLLPPYWRFLAHTFVSCISGRKGGSDKVTIEEICYSCVSRVKGASEVRNFSETEEAQEEPMIDAPVTDANLGSSKQKFQFSIEEVEVSDDEEDELKKYKKISLRLTSKEAQMKRSMAGSADHRPSTRKLKMYKISELQANLGGLTTLYFDLKQRLFQPFCDEFQSLGDEGEKAATFGPTPDDPVQQLSSEGVTRLAPNEVIDQYLSTGPTTAEERREKQTKIDQHRLKRADLLTIKNSDQNVVSYNRPEMYIQDVGKRFSDKYSDRSGILVWGVDDDRELWFVKRKSGNVAPFHNPSNEPKAWAFKSSLEDQAKKNFTRMKIASSFTKKAEGVINPHKNKTMVNVMWPPTAIVKSVPISKRFPDGTLDAMQFRVYDEATSTVVIPMLKTQIRLVDPKDLLKFGE